MIQESQQKTHDKEPQTSARALLDELSRLYKFQPATAFWRAIELNEVIKAGLPATNGLDLGCGDGALTGLIIQKLGIRPNLIGLDPDPQEIKVAERRGVYSQTICSGGEAIPLEENSIDFIFSNSVLEHIPELESTISECSRILKPGGKFIATVPAPGFHKLLKARNKSGKSRDKYISRMDARLAHINYLDEEAWRKILLENGLVLDQATGYMNMAQVRRWEQLSALTAGILQSLGASNRLLYRLQRLTRSDDRTAGGALSGNKPTLFNRLWARAVSGRTSLDSDSDSDSGCLLIQAHKPDNRGI